MDYECQNADCNMVGNVTDRPGKCLGCGQKKTGVKA